MGRFTLEELRGEQRRRELSKLTDDDLQELINIEQYKELKREKDKRDIEKVIDSIRKECNIYF